jgi:DNA-binding CsgD family transcriptional regulator
MSRHQENAPAEHDVATPIPEPLLRFLVTLPIMADQIEWATRFRDVLAEFLDDVDRISVNVSRFGMYNDQSSSQAYAITYHVPSPQSPPVYSLKPIASHGRYSPVERILADMREGGFPLDSYQSPRTFDYHADAVRRDRGSYLGTIFLWRRTDQPPISQQTLDTVGALEPFLTFVFSTIVARNGRHRQVGHQIEGPLREVTDRYDLTTREHLVLLTRLLGFSYKDAAPMLGISIATFKKHMNNVHRKTGTSNLPELFGRHFISEEDESAQ